MIIGARGLGKTYGVRKYMIEDYLKNGYCFVEVTRFREENNDVAANYFSRIIQDDIFPEYEFRTTNKIAEIRKKKTGKKENEWKTIGYFIPLSLQQQKKKSTYVNVRNICMDEIIIDNDDRYHTYLKNEFEQLAKLVDTVTRERADDTELRKPRIFLLGNACDAFNPYFQHYDVPLEPEFGLQWLGGKTCLFDYVRDDAYAEQKTKNTVSGRMLKNNDDMTAKNRFKRLVLRHYGKPDTIDHAPNTVVEILPIHWVEQIAHGVRHAGLRRARNTLLIIVGALKSHFVQNCRIVYSHNAYLLSVRACSRDFPSLPPPLARLLPPRHRRFP
jgi:hypothetical protein